MSPSPPLPPSTAFVQLANGVLVSYLFTIVRHLRLADLFADQLLTAADVARATGLPEPTAARLLRGLVPIGCFRLVDGSEPRYGLGPTGTYLADDRPGAMPHVIDCLARYLLPALGKWNDALGGDVSALEAAFGLPLPGLLENDPEFEALWRASNRETIAGLGVHSVVVDALDWEAHRAVAIYGDVANPAELLRATHNHLSVEPLPLKAAPTAPVDAIVLVRVLAELDDDGLANLFASAADALTTAGRLVVIDQIIPAGGNAHPAMLADLGLMLTTGGRLLTADQLADRLDAHGFDLQSARTHKASGFATIVAAVRS